LIIENALSGTGNETIHQYAVIRDDRGDGKEAGPQA
jgi:hypothetical protein